MTTNEANNTHKSGSSTWSKASNYDEVYSLLLNLMVCPWFVGPLVFWYFRALRN
jgi:hypothetical protein